MQYRCYKISITSRQIGELQIAADYTEKELLPEGFQNSKITTPPLYPYFGRTWWYTVQRTDR